MPPGGSSSLTTRLLRLIFALYLVLNSLAAIGIMPWRGLASSSGERSVDLQLRYHRRDGNWRPSGLLAVVYPLWGRATDTDRLQQVSL